VSQIDKLVDKMRRSSSTIRFGQVETLLRRIGFVLFNSRGSHRSTITLTAESSRSSDRTAGAKRAILSISANSSWYWDYETDGA
jgi:hypothetical protein